MRYFIFISAIVLFFSSCSTNSKSTLEVFRASDEGLNQSIVIISAVNEMLYHSLEDRMANPDYDNGRTKLWKLNAEDVKAICNGMIEYIDKLKLSLKNEAGLKVNSLTNQEFFREDDIIAVTRLFDEKRKAEGLFERLKIFKKNLFSIDSGLNSEFKHNTQVFTTGFDDGTGDGKTFAKTYFNNIPAIAALAVLSKFENNVKIIENHFSTYCLNSTRVLICRISQVISPIITQNTKYLRGGEYIEIEAGLGVYATMADPKIIIDNKIIEPEYGGLVKYKFKAPPKKGKHILPVKFQYIKPDGTLSFITKNIEYTVLE